jgi:hypothetical protein
MAENFFDRLRGYYQSVIAVLRGEADASSVFPNSTDVGSSREKAYLEFLKLHAPSKCNVFQGGFLFDEDGAESRQLDIIITTDTAPRFNLHNRDGGGKSFSPVEGTLGVVSVKSTLDKKQLFDALEGFASIPPTRSLHGRVPPGLEVVSYEDYPLKILYASSGIAPSTLKAHLEEFYVANSAIPSCRRPNFIHVVGKCLVVRKTDGMKVLPEHAGLTIELPPEEFILFQEDADVGGLAWVISRLQQHASASTHIHFSYHYLLSRLPLPRVGS